MSYFNPFKNFNRIRWKDTLWLNVLRSVCVLPVLIGFSITTGNSTSDSQTSIWFFIFYPFFYPFLVAPILVFFRAIFMAILGGLAGILIIPMSLLFIAGGDPIMFFLHKIKPQLVPIQQYPFICLDVVMFVLKEES